MRSIIRPLVVLARCVIAKDGSLACLVQARVRLAP
jgi:hypothetical protein